MKKTSKHLKVVRNQYEDYPYPTRNPEEERHRLLRFNLSELSAINHYCFAGKKDFSGCNVLVAGAGTGDATIFLAHQLRDMGGHVTHLDFSRASTQVAQKRAKVRGLTHITWVHESLLELPGLGLGPFDYINCTGVLHHLEDPDEGLLALKSALKPDGAMGIMLYARHGRAGVYHMQAMLRLINQNERNVESCIRNAKAVLQTAPPTNWFHHNEHMLDDVRLGDAGIYDMLLHTHDRAYTVPECYDFVERAGLHLGGFSAPLDRLLMTPEYHITDAHLLGRMGRLSQRDREAAMELFTGAILRHSFYVTALPDRCARLDDLDNVPYLFSLSADFAEKFARGMAAARGTGKPMTWSSQGYALSVVPGRYSAELLTAIDGTRSTAQVFDAVREKTGQHPTDAELLADLRPVYDAFSRMDFMLLRGRSVPPFAPV